MSALSPGHVFKDAGSQFRRRALPEVLFSLAGAIVTAVVVWLSSPGHRAGLARPVLTGVAAFGIVAAMAFVWHLLRAPYRIGIALEKRAGRTDLTKPDWSRVTVIVGNCKDERPEIWESRVSQVQDGVMLMIQSQARVIDDVFVRVKPPEGADYTALVKGPTGLREPMQTERRPVFPRDFPDAPPGPVLGTHYATWTVRTAQVGACWFDVVKDGVVLSGRAPDKALYEELRSLLPGDGVIAFMRGHDFGGSWSRETIAPIRTFGAVWGSDPEREFLDPELEALRKALCVSVDRFWGLVAAHTFPHRVDPESQELPKELGEEERTKLVEQLNDGADSVVRAYDNLVRRARSKLG